MQASRVPTPRSDKSYWTHGYVLVSKELEGCAPAFLKHIARDAYVCGKTINLLKLCCPRVRGPSARCPVPEARPSARPGALELGTW